MQVSVHVVDTTYGMSAEGVPIELRRPSDADSLSQSTDADGYAMWSELPAWNTYQLTINVGLYFASCGVFSVQSSMCATLRPSAADKPIDLLIQISPTSTQISQIL